MPLELVSTPLLSLHPTVWTPDQDSARELDGCGRSSFLAGISLGHLIAHSPLNQCLSKGMNYAY